MDEKIKTALRNYAYMIAWWLQNEYNKSIPIEKFNDAEKRIGKLEQLLIDYHISDEAIKKIQNKAKKFVSTMKIDDMSDKQKHLIAKLTFGLDTKDGGLVDGFKK